MDLIDSIRDALAPYRSWIWGLGVFSAVSMILGILLVPVWIGRLPSDWFRGRRRPHPAPWSAWRVAALILRNLLGWLLVAAGIAMLVLPGQGILTILLGLGLVEFPGKHRFENWIVRRAPVRKALDWLRRRRGVEPFDFGDRAPGR